jgi:hypothetical protein
VVGGWSLASGTAQKRGPSFPGTDAWRKRHRPGIDPGKARRE